MGGGEGKGKLIRGGVGGAYFKFRPIGGALTRRVCLFQGGGGGGLIRGFTVLSHSVSVGLPAAQLRDWSTALPSLKSDQKSKANSYLQYLSYKVGTCITAKHMLKGIGKPIDKFALNPQKRAI